MAKVAWIANEQKKIIRSQINWEKFLWEGGENLITIYNRCYENSFDKFLEKSIFFSALRHLERNKIALNKFSLWKSLKGFSCRRNRKRNRGHDVIRQVFFRVCFPDLLHCMGKENFLISLLQTCFRRKPQTA